MQVKIVQSVGPLAPGQTVSSDDFPAGTDFDRLLRLGAIALLPGEPPPDPPKVSNLKRQLAAAQSTITSLQAEVNLANAKIAELETASASQAEAG